MSHNLRHLKKEKTSLLIFKKDPYFSGTKNADPGGFVNFSSFEILKRIRFMEVCSGSVALSLHPKTVLTLDLKKKLVGILKL